MCFLYDWWMTRIKILVVEMAGYYLSSVFCVVMDRVEVDVHYNEKKRNEANICPSKKVLLYSTNILTSLFRESEKKANCVWSTI